MTETDRDGVYALIAEIDGKHGAGHTRHANALARIGDSLDDLERRMTAAESTLRSTGTGLDNLKDRKVEISNLRLTWREFVGFGIFLVALVGGQKWSSAGVTGEVSAINVKVDAIKQHEEDSVKLQEERLATMTREIGRISGQTIMIDTKLNNLMISTAGRK